MLHGVMGINSLVVETNTSGSPCLCWIQTQKHHNHGYVTGRLQQTIIHDYCIRVVDDSIAVVFTTGKSRNKSGKFHQQKMISMQPSNSPLQLLTSTTASEHEAFEDEQEEQQEDEQEEVNDAHNGKKEKKKITRKKKQSVENDKEDVKEEFPQLVILVQGKLQQFHSWCERIVNDSNGNVILIYAAFDRKPPRSNKSEQCQAIHIPNTTWTEGRNELSKAAYCLENHRKQDFKYWIFSDDDIDIDGVSFQEGMKKQGIGGWETFSCWKSILHLWPTHCPSSRFLCWWQGLKNMSRILLAIGTMPH